MPKAEPNSVRCGGVDVARAPWAACQISLTGVAGDGDEDAVTAWYLSRTPVRRCDLVKPP